MVALKRLILSCLSLCAFTFSSAQMSKPLPKKEESTPLPPLKPKEYKIGILQTASHPSLDQAREGFIRQVKSKLPAAKITFVTNNGEGQLTQIQTIAKSFKAHVDIDLLYVIATPALQAMAREEKTRPIVFAAVTSPETLGITPTSAPNVIGVTDNADTQKQVSILKDFPLKHKKIGLLFNPSEKNSELMVKKMRESLSQEKLFYQEFGLHTTTDILPTLNRAAKKVDLIWVPLDNLIAASMPLIAKKCKELKIPLMASHVAAVEQGALLAVGIDYMQSGEQAADLALRVLVEGKKPVEVGIQEPKEFQVAIHAKTLQALSISLPETIMKQATLVDN